MEDTGGEWQRTGLPNRVEVLALLRDRLQPLAAALPSYNDALQLLVLLLLVVVVRYRCDRRAIR